MNPTEQKAHTRATDELRKDLGKLESAVTHRTFQMEQTVKNDLNKLLTRFDQLGRQLQDERTHRLKLTDEQRKYVDTQDQELWRYLEFTENARGKFQARTFWSRLNWLLTGR